MNSKQHHSSFFSQLLNAHFNPYLKKIIIVSTSMTAAAAVGEKLAQTAKCLLNFEDFFSDTLAVNTFVLIQC